MQKHMLTDIKFTSSNLEIWGGIECTINRVGDRYLNQLDYSGFNEFDDRLEKVLTLGIKKLRFPVLWEQHQPVLDEPIDWSKTAERLNTLRDNGVEPIAGLVHHGSGPTYTNLLDKEFPEKLAAYAKQVAIAFPWLEYYTPVNEPLTTARFSGLYGIWYPHECSDHHFLKMLINQVRAVVLCMKEIRKINPNAKLIQTEDLGKTYSTEKLQYQARFENERRWLTYDLLCGRVDRKHKLYNYLLESGVTPDDLNYFQQHICPPDIMGFNHYVTSERFLDERIHLYPPHLQGGNDVDTYVDTEVVRVAHDLNTGLRVLLTEAWERYNRPMAMTEVHLHCSREEQMRWFKRVYDDCCELRRLGISVAAVTAWSLFGAYGWNKLLTQPEGDYEPGVFDLRSETPRETAMTKMIRSLCINGHFSHPLIDGKGWWERNIRIIYSDSATLKHMSSYKHPAKQQPLLIIGKRGTLGRAFARICALRGIPYQLLGRDELDLCDQQSIESCIDIYKPWAIINAAGFVRVEDAEEDVAKCFCDNTQGPAQLAACCSAHGIRLLTFSSDLVFDGKKESPYIEADPTSPLNVYGQSKADKEKLVCEINPDALIIRTSAFFGPWDEYNFVHDVIRTLERDEAFFAVDDVMISPTYVPDLVHASLDILIDEEKGLWHLANSGETSWYEFAREAANRAHLNESLIEGRKLSEMNWKAARPLYSVLKSSKGIYLPTLDNALQRYFAEKTNQSIQMAV